MLATVHVWHVGSDMATYLPFLFTFHGIDEHCVSSQRPHISFLSNKLIEPASDDGQQIVFIFFRIDADRHSQQQRLDLQFTGAWEDSVWSIRYIWKLLIIVSSNDSGITLNLLGV